MIKSFEADLNKDPDPRIEIYKKTIGLSYVLRGMKLAANDHDRLNEIKKVFDDPEAVDNFVNGANGIDALMANAEGKRMALLNGWPAADLELISSLYQKRAIIEKILSNTAPADEKRAEYEGAYKVLGEICEKIDTSVIHSAKDRKDILEYIESYGDAFFNDTIARMGQADRGQLAVMKNAFTDAKNMLLNENLFLKEKALNNLNLAIENNNANQEVDLNALRAEKHNIMPEAYFEKFYAPEFIYDKKKEYIDLSTVNSKKLEGYFEDEDLKNEAVKLNKSYPFMMATRRISLYHDMKAWYLGQDDSGSYAEATKKLLEATDEEKRDIQNRFLADLKAHPISDKNTPMDEENIRYFARIHKKAMEKFANEVFPALDMKDISSITELGNYAGKLGEMAAFSLDFFQDTTGKLDFADSAYNRSAYIDEMGGSEIYNKLNRIQTFVRDMTELSTRADPDNKINLVKGSISTAIARHLMERVNKKLSGRKLNDLKVDEMQEVFDYLRYVKVSDEFPLEGRPSDDLLEAYINGKIDSPFSEDYIKEIEKGIFNNKLKDREVLFNETHNKKLDSILSNKFRHPENVYGLNYVVIDPASKAGIEDIVNDMQGRKTDYKNIDEKMRRETNMVFLEIFDIYTDETSGQYDLLDKKGETALDRFCIDGKKVSEVLSEMGYKKESFVPGSDNWEIACKAEILKAFADKNKKLTFVPYMIDKSGEIKEDKAIEIKKLPVGEINNNVNNNLPMEDDIGAKYYLSMEGLYNHSVMMKSVNFDEPVYQKTKAEIEIEYYNTMDQTNDQLANKEKNRYYAYNNLYTGNLYEFIKGQNTNRSLTEEGKKNLKDVRKLLDQVYEKSMEDASKVDATDPMLAEILRCSAENYRTADGELHVDLMRNTAFMQIFYQLPTTGIGPDDDPTSSKKRKIKEQMKGITGYPAENALYPIDEIFSRGRRMVLAQLAHKNLSKDGKITIEEDRLCRNMLISELDSLERSMEKIDDFVRKSKVNASSEAKFAETLKEKYLDNDVDHMSSYYSRGLKTAREDIKGKRVLLANGWPMKDLDFLSSLFALRVNINEKLDANRKDPQETKIISYYKKVLEQVCNELENHPIKNAEDRMKMLNMIKAYSEELFNKYTLNTVEAADSCKKELDSAIQREIVLNEYLAEDELKNARDDYNNYLNIRKLQDLNKASVNGPLTREEKGLINPAYIKEIMESANALGKDDALKNSP
ncbi:MAG: hypothetical protein K5894_11160, partial [Lachnospiraceae bacterium]|nr:hypothetical protein [Lachnospiraceae bacterium]